MSRLTDLLLARREATPAPIRNMIGFPSDGGILPYGVTGLTAVGISAVWRAVDILSNGVSQLRWSERRGNLELFPSRLVQRPQAERTRREWTSLVTATLALYDVCYLLKVGGVDGEGVPMALWPLDPTIVMPATQDFVTYLPPETFYVGGTSRGAVAVNRDQLVILHRGPLPGVQDNVAGVINLARTTFAAAIAAENFASRYWQAGGTPNTVLEADAQIPDPIATQIADRWRERRQRGPDYAPVLSGGVKARTMGADPTTESAVEARRELVADIARYFGIPTRLMNAPTGDSETYANAQSANQDLVRYTLQNYIGAIEDGVSDLLPGGRHLVLEPDVLTRPDFLTFAQAAQLAVGGPWLTKDEAREVWDMAPQEMPDPDLVVTAKEPNPPPGVMPEVLA